MSAESLSGGARSASPSPSDCEHAIRRLWDYLDGRLPELAHDEVNAHLATCELCAARFAFARTMLHALKQSADRDRLFGPGTETATGLRARVREALRRQGDQRAPNVVGESDSISE